MSETEARLRTRPLRAAVIGCGRIGSLLNERNIGAPETHAATMARDSRVQLVALVEIDEHRRNAAQQFWGIPGAYVDYRHLFADEVPDLISICTPPDTHEEILLAAIQAGVKGIWAEKPIASTCDEAEEVLQAVERSETTVVLNYTRRFSHLYQQLRQDLAGGMIGEIVQAHVFYVSGLANNGSHAIDISRYLFGDIARALGEDCLHESTPDPSLDARLVTKSGVNIHLQALPSTNYDIFELRIFGTLGRVDLVEHGTIPVFFRRAAGEHYITGYSLQVQDRSYPQGIEDAWPRALANLVATCRGEEQPICSVRDGWESMRIVEAVRQSAKQTERVSAE